MSYCCLTSRRSAAIMLSLCVLLLFTLLGRQALVRAAAVSTAYTYYVSPSGSDGNSGTPSAPKLTIQAAINVSANGDTVIVEDGTYSGPGNVDLDFGGRNIKVTSQNGAASTIIDCQGSSSANHRGFYLHSGETNAVISGLTIKNGYAGFGGGIFNDNGNAGTITVTNCTLTGNTANYHGGGIFNDNGNTGTITVTNCMLTGNTATSGYGGGIYNGNYNSNAGTITVTNCTLTGNTANYHGGGIFNDNGNAGTITVTNCTLTGNTASYDGGGIFNDNGNTGTITVTNCMLTGNTATNGGGGIYNYNSSAGTATVTNCTLTGNTATRGYGGGISIFNSGGTFSVTNDILYSDTILYGDTGSEIYAASGSLTVSYCDVQGGYAGTGNIDADPRFANGSPPYDLHLQTGSPCIGAGTASGAPTTTIDGQARPTPPSIGAYESLIHITPLYVSPSGSDANPGIQSAPKLTIQAAVNAAQSGDTIIVEDGTYSGVGNRDIDFAGRNLTVQAASSDPAKTVIDCGGSSTISHRGFYFHTGETSAALSGLTIKNGHSNFATDGNGNLSKSSFGGAVSIESGCTVKLTGCTLTGNSAHIGGGLASTGTTTLTNCTLDSNTATYCGGIYNNTGTITVNQSTISGNTGNNGGGMQSGGTAILNNCLIAGNYSQSYGGGVNNNGGTLTVSSCDINTNTAFSGGGIFNYGTATVTNCILTANTAYTDFYSGPGGINGGGGAIYCYVGQISVTNCTLTANTATNGGGIYDGINGGATLTNDILYGDVTGSGSELYAETSASASAIPSVLYCDIQGGYAGTANINADPLFASGSNPYDLHLQAGSPCDGAGTSSGAPARDIVGVLRDNPPSIGAFEGPRRAGTATGLTSSLNPSSRGQSVTFTATVTDTTAGSSTAPTGNVQFASDGVSIGSPVALSGGMASVSTTTLPAGPHTITASFISNGRYKGSTGSLTQTVNVVATHFTVTAPSSVNAGALFSITVTAQDDSGNTVTSYTGMVHFNSSDYQAQLPADATLTNGVGTFTVKLHNVGSQTITAYQTTNYNVTGVSGPINVTQGTPTTRTVPGQYATIQAAIDASADGDIVLVGDGTYSGAGNRDLDFHGDTLTVQSQNGPAKTIIDCGGVSSNDGSGDHRGFYFHTGESSATVSGFTIKNGYESGYNGSNGNGGAVDIENSPNGITNLMLTNCILSADYAAYNGGGVSVGGGQEITLTGCTLTGNSTADNGGGLFNSGFATLTNCVFDSNSTYGYGGAVCNGAGTPVGPPPTGGSNFTGPATLTGCTFTHNSASSDGGALYNGGGILTLDSCLLSGNTATNGNGGALSNANSISSTFTSMTTSGQATLTDCILTGNSATNGNGGAINNGYPPFSISGSGYFSGSLTLTNCLLAGNSVPNSSSGSFNGNGGGLYTNGGYSNLTSCSLTANTAGSGGGIYSDTQASVSLNDDILYGDTSNEITDNANTQNGGPPNNVNATYCDIEEASGPGNFSDNGGNINSDPLFVSAPGNLHLQSGSPCIGAGGASGAPATDLDGVTRPTPPSIGAYEGKKKAATGTTVISSLNRSVSGQRVTFTATVTGTGGTPTGLVTFKDGTTVIGSAGLDGSGKAALTTATLVRGTHSITASYGGDTGFATSTSSALTQTVTEVATSVTMTSSAGNSVFGQTVTFRASVAPVSPGTGTPTGSVSFTEGAMLLQKVNLANGAASYTTAALPVGSHAITATYNGDTSYDPSSGTVTQTVGQANTTTALVFSSSAKAFTATVTPVSPGAGTPTGTFTFTLDNVSSAPVSLSGGQATYQPTLSDGSHTVTATYSGDVSFAGSTSPTVMQAGGKGTTTTLTSRINPAALNQPFLLTATVTGNGSTPTGSVTFTGDYGFSTTVPLNSAGQASINPNGFSPGSHPFTAFYNGDANFNTSSGSFTETVSNLKDVTTNVTVAYGGLAHAGTTYSQGITLTNTSGLPIAGPVSLVLVGLPSNVILTGVGTAGTTSGGYPYLTILNGASLPTGNTSVSLRFSNPSGAKIAYTLRVVAGAGVSSYQP